jgi:cytoskeleton protein RodZ
MSMQELGELFKTARQEAGLSLQDVYERTKISLYVLEALEGGDVAGLPHPVYTKGFIRNYADLLGLDQDRVAREYLAAVGPVDALEIDTGVPELNARRKTRAKTGKLRLIVMGMAILAAAGWLVVSYVSREIEPVPPVVMDQNAGNEAETSSPEPVTRGDVTPAEDTSREAATADQGVINEAAEMTDDQKADLAQQGELSRVQEQGDVLVPDDAEEAGSQAVQDIPIASLSEESETPALPATAQVDSREDVTGSYMPSETPEAVVKAHVLRIEATHECWLQATADKESALYKTVRLLKPGQRVSIPFDQYVELKLGNAGGVRLFLNDAPYAIKGGLGDVATLVVSAPAE